MFSHNESYLREPLKKPLLDVYKGIMKYESIFEKIEAANPDVKAYEIEPEYAERRALRSLKANNIDELVMSVKDIHTMPGNKFILAYCDCPDAILHKYGTTSEEARNFILDAERKVEEMCSSFDEDTIVIISADHGHKDIENAYSVSVSLLDAGLQSYGQSTYKMQLPPDADTASGTTAKRADQCHIKDNRDFKGLSERLLKQAKEYDLLKLKYNTLLSIWKQTETKINNFN